jgi:hypothetical protein
MRNDNDLAQPMRADPAIQFAVTEVFTLGSVSAGDRLLEALSRRRRRPAT